MESVKISFLDRLKLQAVDVILFLQNISLSFFQFLLFRKISNPQNILIFKVGNIGDIICAVPAFIAIRASYPGAKITLLTSPGERGMLGSKELLEGVEYLDFLLVYYADDISTFQKKKVFIKKLRAKGYDLFIQIPDDYAHFRTMLRNIFFAKLLGVRNAFGFRIRTILNLFKNQQVDYLFSKTEVQNILDMLQRYIPIDNKPEFKFNISPATEEKVNGFVVEKFGAGKHRIVIINPGAKRESNEWPVERYNLVAKQLVNDYGAKIIVIGGPKDLEKAKIIGREVSSENFVIFAGNLNLLETLALIKHSDLVLSNDTGAVHMAAAVGRPVVGIYNVRNVPGKWFPFGKHRILYHRFIQCDYRDEECMKKSIEQVTVKEVISACEDIIKQS